jgi:hypothetical protein
MERCNFFLSGKLASVELKEKVSGFKDEPTNAELLAAAQARAKQYGYKETISYVYPTTGWTNQYELLGLTALNTLTHRVMEIGVVFKDEKGVCSYEVMGIRQDNLFATGSLDENFKGQKVYTNYNGNLQPIDCTKAQKYKK